MRVSNSSAVQRALHSVRSDCNMIAEEARSVSVASVT